MKTQVEERFSEFHEKWVTQLESDLQLLVKASREGGPTGAHHEALVGQLMAHHKAYYMAKWAAAHDDVLAFFGPVWLSPLENAYLWVTGWKPSTVFRFVGADLGWVGMREEQAKRVEELRVRMRVEEEKKVEREMERQQVAVSDWRMVESAEAAPESLLAGLEKAMKMADCARLKTLKGILELLDPMQCVNFLAATSLMQIQLRRLGKKRERERQTAVDTYHDTNESTSAVVGSLVIA